MSFNDFKKIIDELGAYLYSLRMENWGEPLLNEEIPMMIAYAKSKGIFTSFNTNLCLLDESIAKGLISSGLDHIKISLDGTNEQSYLKYRMGGDFRKVIENIRLLTGIRKRLNKNVPFIQIQFIIMRHNENEIGRMREMVKELGVDGLFLERLRPDMRQELYIADAKSMEMFRQWLPKNDIYSVFDYRSKKRKNRKKTCSYLWTTAVINWDSTVAPCCSVFEEKYDFGNLKDSSFMDIWNSPKYLSARNLIGWARKTQEEVVCVYCFRNGVIA
jgi:radical SAM protein with 4Fe4S-binding SPASM domain